MSRTRHRNRAPVSAASSGLRVLFVQYTDPAGYPPLEHGASLLAEAGCQIRFLGLDLTHGGLALAAHPAISVSLMTPAGSGWRQKRQFLRFVWWTLREARRWKPAWIYASDALSTPAALVLRRLTGARLVYHEHDAPSAAPSSTVMRVVRWCRRQVTREASLVIVPSPDRARVFDADAGPVTVVRNTPLLREVREPRARACDQTRFRLLYHGSIVPARLPLTVVDALTTLPEGVTLTVAGYDTTGGGHLAALVARSRTLGISHRLQVAGLVRTRAELLDLTALCDVGLALMPSETSDLNERTMVGASNKPFDYLACGLAVLVTDLPAWRDLYVAPGYGLACVPESVQSIAVALRWWIEHPDECRRMGEAGRQQVCSTWHYEREFLPVVRRMLGQTVACQPPVPAKAAARA